MPWTCRESRVDAETKDGGPQGGLTVHAQDWGDRVDGARGSGRLTVFECILTVVEPTDAGVSSDADAVSEVEGQSIGSGGARGLIRVASAYREVFVDAI